MRVTLRVWLHLFKGGIDYKNLVNVKMSDVKKNGAKLEVTDKILKKIENKSDLIMDYIKNGKLDPKLGINNFGDARDPEFLKSII